MAGDSIWFLLRGAPAPGDSRPRSLPDPGEIPAERQPQFMDRDGQVRVPRRPFTVWRLAFKAAAHGLNPGEERPPLVRFAKQVQQSFHPINPPLRGGDPPPGGREEVRVAPDPQEQRALKGATTGGVVRV